MNQDLSQFTRFNVVGSSGSGKSTFARKLAETLGIRHVEIDAVYWKPNWVEPDDAEFFPDLHNALAGDSWVVDGNYSRTVPIKWERVQAVVWLDMPYWLIFLSVVRRTLRRSLLNEELWSGNRESLKKAFLSRDSIILWSLTHLHPVRRGYKAAMTDPRFSHITFVRLRSRQETRQFLESLGPVSR